MKKIVKILSFIVLCSSIGMTYATVTYNNNDITNAENGGYSIGNPYTSFNECDGKRIEYNSRYPDYQRSECFQNSNDNKYYYFLCSENESCNLSNITSNSSYNQEEQVLNYISQESGVLTPSTNSCNALSSSLSSKIEIFFGKIRQAKSSKTEAEYITILNGLKNKLLGLESKYANNSDIMNLINCIIAFTDLEKQILAGNNNNNNNNNDIDDFFCDLEGNCENTNTKVNTGNPGESCYEWLTRNNIPTSNVSTKLDYGENNVRTIVNNNCVYSVWSENENKYLCDFTHLSNKPIIGGYASMPTESCSIDAGPLITLINNEPLDLDNYQNTYCQGGNYDGYQVPTLNNNDQSDVQKNITNGSSQAVAFCNNGNVEIDPTGIICNYLYENVTGSTCTLITQANSYCQGGNYDGYQVPTLNNNDQIDVEKNINNGISNAVAFCYEGNMTIDPTDITCNSGYENVTGGTCTLININTVTIVKQTSISNYCYEYDMSNGTKKYANCAIQTSVGGGLSCTLSNLKNNRNDISTCPNTQTNSNCTLSPTPNTTKYYCIDDVVIRKSDDACYYGLTTEIDTSNWYWIPEGQTITAPGVKYVNGTYIKDFTVTKTLKCENSDLIHVSSSNIPYIDPNAQTNSNCSLNPVPDTNKYYCIDDVALRKSDDACYYGLVNDIGDNTNWFWIPKGGTIHAPGAKYVGGTYIKDFSVDKTLKCENSDVVHVNTASVPITTNLKDFLNGGYSSFAKAALISIDNTGKRREYPASVSTTNYIAFEIDSKNSYIAKKGNTSYYIHWNINPEGKTIYTRYSYSSKNALLNWAVKRTSNTVNTPVPSEHIPAVEARLNTCIGGGACN